jgi:dTDP-4-dehydrorhamnose reductase
MARILLLGSRGQLGIELGKALAPGAELLALSRQDVNLSDGDALRAAIRQAGPKVIVNAAAYTAVDRAETEPELAHAVNAVAPRIMAEEALRVDGWLIHFSTDYVFDGSGREPSKETDSPRPLNVYGRTKLEGERAIAATGCRHLIFRTSWVYAAHGSNFLRTMLRLGRERPRLTVVDDQFGAPTSAGELARGVRTVLNRLANCDSAPVESGIYHMTCSGVTTWFGFAKAIFSNAEGMVPTPEIIPIPSEQYPTPAARPRNSVLNCDKLEKTFGIRLAPWEGALAQVMMELRACFKNDPVN